MKVITQSNVAIIICVAAVMFFVLGGLSLVSHLYSLNGIKSKTVGDGQHGTARWATQKEIHQTYKQVSFHVADWRKGMNLPKEQGLVVGCEGKKGSVTALVDTGDVHCLMIGASGVGKTAFYLYPNLEYACASGMSFLVTDTKGDVYRNYGEVAKDCYGYNVAVIDLRTEIQKVMYCGRCGAKLVRLANQKGHERWKCEACGAISHTVRDTHLIQGVSQLLHALPSELRSPQAPRQESLDIMRLKNELGRILDNPEHDEVQAKALIMELAAARYALLGNEEYETERVRRLLKSLPHTAELNTDLFRQVVSAVMVYPGGEVAIKLKNNQIIERNDLS